AERSSPVASATMTAPGRSSAVRFAPATAARTGSRSTPATTTPARASATRSPPMPQPRSRTDVAPVNEIRAARCAATSARVDCSRPSAVKYIRCASSPNLARAAARRVACAIAAAARSGATARRSSSPARIGSTSSACSATAEASVACPSAVRSQRNASRSTCRSLTCLALDLTEC
ncbi:MAG: hypothetical protein AVDCRST_MAG34-1026, partial [uncultured Nocardioidaceae bacterium]